MKIARVQRKISRVQSSNTNSDVERNSFLKYVIADTLGLRIPTKEEA